MNVNDLKFELKVCDLTRVKRMGPMEQSADVRILSTSFKQRCVTHRSSKKQTYFHDVTEF